MSSFTEENKHLLQAQLGKPKMSMGRNCTVWYGRLLLTVSSHLWDLLQLRCTSCDKEGALLTV